MLVCYTKLHAFNVFYMIDECHLNGRPTRVSRRKTKGRRRLTNWPVNVEASHHHHWNTSQQQISLHDDDVEDLYFSFVGVLVHLIIVYCLSCSYCCCCCCYPLFFIWIRECDVLRLESLVFSSSSRLLSSHEVIPLLISSETLHHHLTVLVILHKHILDLRLSQVTVFTSQLPKIFSLWLRSVLLSS